MACALVIYLRPIYGLIIYIAAFAYYPTYLSVPVGTIDFTLIRIVILAIYLKLFLGTRLPRNFRLILLDKLLIVYFVAQIVAGFMTGSPTKAFLENRAGAVFDMVLPYFVVRMIVTKKEDYLLLLKGILVIAAPISLIGLYQCLTGHNPAGFMKQYAAWGSQRYVPEYRLGFYRADVTFSISIMFGLFFAMLGPICAGVLGYVKKNKWIYRVGLGLMVVGVFSSMSAGPWLAVGFAVPFVAFFRYRKYWKVGIATVVVLCALVEIISNRHFYEVIDRFTFSGSTAWYRARLIHVGLFEGGMSGHWLVGYGDGTGAAEQASAEWSAKIDNRPQVDMVNHYLVILFRYGLIALVPFFGVIFVAIRRLIQAAKLSLSDLDNGLIWCLAAALFGTLGAMTSTMLFGPPINIFYIMLGFCGIMPTLIGTGSIAFREGMLYS